MSDEHYSAIAKIISENREKHEKQIKEFCVTTQMCTFQDFLFGYENETKAIDALQAVENKHIPCSLSSFKETFQIFDKYPSNIQKPKKQLTKDLNRTLISHRSQSSSDLAIDKVAPTAENWEKGPEVSEIYSKYRKFLKIYKQLEESSKNDIELKYVEAMQKIHSLAKNIEKLQDDELESADVAFTTEDVNMLREFIINFEKALFVDENQNMFKDFSQNDQSLQNVTNVNELLNYCFDKIGQFRDN